MLKVLCRFILKEQHAEAMNRRSCVDSFPQYAIWGVYWKGLTCLTSALDSDARRRINNEALNYRNSESPKWML